MEKEVVNVLANVVIAFSTFVGVGGAIAYYMAEARTFETWYIIFVLFVYVIMVLITLNWIKENIR